MANFDLTNLAIKTICPNNEAKIDDTGLPSMMVYIPAFKNSDVLTGGDDSIHPAFIVNGKQIPGFWYSKYQNCTYNGVAYSLPAEDPQANITFDTAAQRSAAKGHGWHISTNAEWAAIALWCRKNGTIPLGNNNYGKDVSESNYRAIGKTTDSGKTVRVATGTGPLTWSHDGTLSGIWDLNGNVWEWQAGIRLVWGELQIFDSNNAADYDNPQNATSVCWKAINASAGALVEPECKTTDSEPKTTGNTIKLDFVSNIWTYTTSVSSSVDSYRSCEFGKATCTSSICGAAKVLLRALALLPDEGSSVSDYNGDIMYWNNRQPERFVFRGGSWSLGSYAGVFSLNGGYPRSYSYSNVGFRSALIPEI
ncbi:MAG: formylglycine-generating enzyme family protein [Oscillospiraceae bacterium]|nr:formylglycine-generating enzyme family protein [Oscillospiraceae bacterium]